jgi:hypothetical protein
VAEQVFKEPNAMGTSEEITKETPWLILNHIGQVNTE